MKKKISKASFVKKVGTVVLSCVLLFGQGTSAAAAASSAAIQREPTHVHAFSVLEWHLIGFAPYQHHDYIYGYNEGEPDVRTCAIWMYVYSGELVCACGETNGSKSKPEYVHLNCGQ